MNKKYIIWIVIIVIIAGGIFFLFDKKGDVKLTKEENGQDLVLTKTYEDPQSRFSFKYPESYNVNSYPDDVAEILVVQGSDSKRSFQIRIEPIDEDLTSITPERIRKDVPDIVMTDTQEVLIGDGGRGTAFLSDDPSFGGKSREVWFAHDHVFYQITAYAEADPLVQAVLSTWTFK